MLLNKLVLFNEIYHYLENRVILDDNDTYSEINWQNYGGELIMILIIIIYPIVMVKPQYNFIEIANQTQGLQAMDGSPYR